MVAPVFDRVVEKTVFFPAAVEDASSAFCIRGVQLILVEEVHILQTDMSHGSVTVWEQTALLVSSRQVIVKGFVDQSDSRRFFVNDDQGCVNTTYGCVSFCCLHFREVRTWYLQLQE
jgi:hypothetical protein